MPFHVFNRDYSIPREHSPLTSTTSASIIEFARFESEVASGSAKEKGRFKEVRGPLSTERSVSDLSMSFRAAIQERAFAKDFESREYLSKCARTPSLAEKAAKRTKVRTLTEKETQATKPKAKVPARPTLKGDTTARGTPSNCSTPPRQGKKDGSHPVDVVNPNERNRSPAIRASDMLRISFTNSRLSISTSAGKSARIGAAPHQWPQMRHALTYGD